MNHNPLVSIIVTTYNRKELLKETIDSITNQTFEHFELIIIDNFSDYDFFKYVASFKDSRIRPYQNRNNGIIAVNRNYGIRKAKGKYIAFCDDDDIWFPKKLEKQINLLKNTQNHIVFTMRKQFGETSIFSKYFGIGPLSFTVNTSTRALLQKNCIALSSVMIEKEIMDRIGFFNEKKSYIAIEDYDLWIRVSQVTRIEFIPEVLILHRVHKSNIYENMSNINEGLKEMKISYGVVSNLKAKEKIKQNPIYYFIRNLFYFSYEKLFNKSIYSLK